MLFAWLLGTPVAMSCHLPKAAGRLPWPLCAPTRPLLQACPPHPQPGRTRWNVRRVLLGAGRVKLPVVRQLAVSVKHVKLRSARGLVVLWMRVRVGPHDQDRPHACIASTPLPLAYIQVDQRLGQQHVGMRGQALQGRGKGGGAGACEHGKHCKG